MDSQEWWRNICWAISSAGISKIVPLATRHLPAGTNDPSIRAWKVTVCRTLARQVRFHAHQEKKRRVLLSKNRFIEQEKIYDHDWT